jgi:hypothetical protein
MPSCARSTQRSTGAERRARPRSEQVDAAVVGGVAAEESSSTDQNRSYREIVTEILREGEETDRQEDERFGDRRGDELPEQLHTPEARRAAWSRPGDGSWSGKGRSPGADADGEPVEAGQVAIDPQRSLTGHGGRREWFRAGRRELEEHRER